jgi:two-component system, OmpR family, KDP operon response regulator KdpE
MTSGTILIVDDEPQIRRVLRTTLSAEGYEVVDARSGEDALLRVREDHFDLILLDLNMPGMGGLEACRELRAKSDVAIIMLTVRSEEADKVKALDAGADDYITKPFSMPELLARIRAALRRLPVPPSSGVKIITLGKIEINMSTRRVKSGAKELRLTPKEYDLLGYLMSSPNVPIPHGKLLQAVWGPDYGSEVEYLRVFINQLRKKIEADPSHPRFLLTEPWVGYRFSPPTEPNS